VFSPRAVRKRLQKAGVKYTDPKAPASIDYKAHSQALHVNPWPNLLAGRGISRGDFLTDDVFWWEVYEHARQLLLAIESLRGLPGYDWDDLPAMAALGKVKKGHELAMAMQHVYLALVKVVAERSTEVGRSAQSE